MGFKTLIKATVIVLVISVTLIILASYLPKLERKKLETQLENKMEKVRQGYQEEVRQLTLTTFHSASDALTQVIKIAECQKVIEVLQALFPLRFLESALKVAPNILENKLKEIENQVSKPFHREFLSLVSKVQMLEKVHPGIFLRSIGSSLFPGTSGTATSQSFAVLSAPGGLGLSGTHESEVDTVSGGAEQD